jgi:anti-anti-sigma factor
MQINSKKNGSILILRPQLEYLDITNSLEFKLGVSRAANQKYDCLILDLSQLQKTDSSGLGIIINIGLGIIAVPNRKFALCGIHKAIEKSIQLTNAQHLFPIYADENAAIEALTPSGQVFFPFAFAGEGASTFEKLSVAASPYGEFKKFNSVDELLNSKELTKYPALFIASELLTQGNKRALEKLRTKIKKDAVLIALTSAPCRGNALKQLKNEWSITHVIEIPINSIDAETIMQELGKFTKVDHSTVESTLFDHYTKTLDGKIENIETLLDLASQTPNRENFENLRNAFHKMAGSAGSYGFSKAGDACRTLELLLSEAITNGLYDNKHIENISQLFDRAKFFLNSVFCCSSAMQGNTLKSISKGTACLISDDENIIEIFKTTTNTLSCNLTIVLNPEEFIKSLPSLNSLPELVIVDRTFNKNSSDGFEVLKAIKQMGTSGQSLTGLILKDDNLDDHIRASEQGITFVIKKPLSQESVENVLKRVISNDRRLTYKVLAVDDDADIGLYIKNALEEIGIEVSILNDETQILNTLDKQQPQLLLLDINLPRYSGWSLLKSIRTDMRYRDLKIIIITAENEIEEMRQSHGLTYDDIWRKPLEKTKLQKSIYALAMLTRMSPKQLYIPTTLLGAREFAHMLDTINKSCAANKQERFLVLINSREYQQVTNRGSGAYREFITACENTLNQHFSDALLKGYLNEGWFAFLFVGLTKDQVTIQVQAGMKSLEYKIVLPPPDEIVVSFQETIIEINEQRKGTEWIALGQEAASHTHQAKTS